MPRPQKFENAVLSLHLGLPSTLIRLENGAFRKRSSNRRNLETPALLFKSVDGNILTMEPFENYDVAIIMWFPFKNINLIWPVIVARSNFASVAWTENIWCVFRVKAPIPNFANVDLVRLVRTESNTSFLVIFLHSMHPSAGFEWQINYRPIAILNSSFLKCLEKYLI